MPERANVQLSQLPITALYFRFIIPGLLAPLILSSALLAPIGMGHSRKGCFGLSWSLKHCKSEMSDLVLGYLG